VSAVTSSLRNLTAADRCDRCGAQALVSTTMPTGLELLWCGHHFAENETGLAARNACVTADERHALKAA
jgi:hypothetical protein